MTFAKKQTVANELFTQLEQLFDSDDAPDAFTLAKLGREADALQKVDPASASLVRAGIAALAWDFSETDRWVKNSLRLNSHTDSLHNAGLTYKQINRGDLNTECVLRALTKAPKNKNAVARAIEGLCLCGRYTEAHTIYRRAHADDVAIDPSIFVPGLHVQQMADLGIDPQRVVFEVMAAQEVLARGRKRIRNMTVGVYPDQDGSEAMLIQFDFFGTIGEELHLESTLAQSLADRPGWNPSLLSTELQHVVKHAHEYA